MREDLLHYIWKFGKLPSGTLRASRGEIIQVVEVGVHNRLAGPDFFHAKVVVDGQLWAGTVEIHVRSSDWYAHHHEVDPLYNTVILHVVWEDDVDVFRNTGSRIPTLVLQEYIPETLLDAYRDLFRQTGKKFINCGTEPARVEALVWNNWLERLYFERLEHKWSVISELLQATQNDWEKVFFIILAKSFGSKINGEAFFELAQHLDFAVVRKIQNDVFQLESLFFGAAGLLSQDGEGDEYYGRLQTEYHFLRTKFQLPERAGTPPHFFKLRPSNFPTLRLSQLAHLYFKHKNLFGKLMSAPSIAAIYKILEVSASPYWDAHYTFGKESRPSQKKLTPKFMDILIINAILPMKIGYAKHRGIEVQDEIIDIIASIKPEENSIIAKFKELGVVFPSALEGQAVLQLYNEYCTRNKCLQCVVGHRLLTGNA